MKPSGPGLLFVGRFLITDPISVLGMSLFQIFCFFMICLGKVYISINLFILGPVVGVKLFAVVSYFFVFL